MANLQNRLDRLEQRISDAAIPQAALVLLPNCDEAAERAKFEQLHGGGQPALVIRCTATDARVRDDCVDDELLPEPLGNASP